MYGTMCLSGKMSVFIQVGACVVLCMYVSMWQCLLYVCDCVCIYGGGMYVYVYVLKCTYIVNKMIADLNFPED